MQINKEFKKLKKQFDEIEKEIADAMIWRGMDRIINI